MKPIIIGIIKSAKITLNVFPPNKTQLTIHVSVVLQVTVLKKGFHPIHAPEIIANIQGNHI